MSTEKEQSYSDKNELPYSKFKFLKCQLKQENEKDVHMGEIMFEIEQNGVYNSAPESGLTEKSISSDKH